jgi:hypothetical protein
MPFSAAGSTHVPVSEGRLHEAKNKPNNPHKAMTINRLFILILLSDLDGKGRNNFLKTNTFSELFS